VCPKGCADLENDPNNCGSCGYACPAPTTSGQVAACSAGTCGFACGDPSLTACTTGSTLYCDDLQTSKYSCGSCNHRCSDTVTSYCQTSSCSGGACSPGVPDPSKDGESCSDNGGTTCGDGMCLNFKSSCTLANGQWQLLNNNAYSVVGTCECQGNVLTSGTVTYATCTACVSPSATQVLCLQ
jgi:hypothetical protein